MDTHSIIKQFTEQLSDSPVEQERISHLAPIEFVLLNLNKDVKIKVDEKHTFLCVPALEKSKGDVSYDDIEYLKITDEKLFELLQQYDQNNINEFIEYLNKEIFKYIQTKVQSAIKKGAWDKTNMWFEPNIKFLEWFDSKGIDTESKSGGILSPRSKWAKEVVNLLKEHGEMKNIDIILALGDKGMLASYNHISQIFKSKSDRKFYNEELVNNGAYWSLKSKK